MNFFTDQEQWKLERSHMLISSQGNLMFGEKKEEEQTSMQIKEDL